MAHIVVTTFVSTGNLNPFITKRSEGRLLLSSSFSLTLLSFQTGDDAILITREFYSINIEFS
jgi:hypothetical protein